MSEGPSFVPSADRPWQVAQFAPVSYTHLDVYKRQAPIDESPAQAQAVQDERIYGSFLLQCVAASAEAKLQPALSALLLRLRERVGEQRVLDLIASSVGATLRN